MAYPWYIFRVEVNCFTGPLLIAADKYIAGNSPGKRSDTMSPLLAEIHARWRQIFTTLQSGGDLPPAQQLRTEGLMEAAILTGELTAEELCGQMADIYSEVYGRTIAHSFGAEWEAFYPFPQIPAAASRAPVYPSTTD